MKIIFVIEWYLKRAKIEALTKDLGARHRPPAWPKEYEEVNRWVSL